MTDLDTNYDPKSVPTWNAYCKQSFYRKFYLGPGQIETCFVPLSKVSINYRKLGLYSGTYDNTPGDIFLEFRILGQPYKYLAGTTAAVGNTMSYAPVACGFLCTQIRALGIPLMHKPKRVTVLGSGVMLQAPGTATVNTSVIDDEDDDFNPIANIA